MGVEKSGETPSQSTARRLRFARNLIEELSTRKQGNLNAFGTTTLRITWKAGEIDRVDHEEAITYK
jgi:hypothetical protein